MATNCLPLSSTQWLKLYTYLLVAAFTGLAGAWIRLSLASWRVRTTLPSTLKVTVYRVPNLASTVWSSAATMELEKICTPSEVNQPWNPSVVISGSSP